MRTNLILLVFAVLTSGLSVSAQEFPYLKRLVTARDEESANKKEDQQSTRALEVVVGRISQAFDKGASRELEGTLAPHKIYVSLKTDDDSGFYGQSQVRFMFEKLFRERETTKFTVDAQDFEFSRDDSAYVRASWTYLMLDEDEVATEDLRFTMERTDGEWRISGIRTSR